jgi:uncharacterized protein YjbJ (UPF0337 family)
MKDPHDGEEFMADKSGPQDAVEGVVEGAKGKAKEVFGAVTGRDDVTREGEAQQDKGEAQRDAAKKEAEAESARGAAKASEERQKANQQLGRKKRPGPISDRALPLHHGPMAASRVIGVSSICFTRSSAFSKTMTAPAFPSSSLDTPPLSTPMLVTCARTRFSVPDRVTGEDSPVGGHPRALQRYLDDVGLRLGGIHVRGRGDLGDQVVTVENRASATCQLCPGCRRMPPVSSKCAHRPSSLTSMRQPSSALSMESANHACAPSALSKSLVATTVPCGSITLNATMREWLSQPIGFQSLSRCCRCMWA